MAEIMDNINFNYELDKYYNHEQITNGILEYEELLDLYHMMEFPYFDSEHLRLRKLLIENKHLFVGDIDQVSDRIVNTYLIYNDAFDLCKKTGITYGNLIRYINYYPNAVNKEEEQSFKQLLMKNNIKLKKHPSKEAQIKGEDIIRICYAFSNTYNVMNALCRDVALPKSYFEDASGMLLQTVKDEIAIPDSVEKEDNHYLVKVRKTIYTQ